MLRIVALALSALAFTPTLAAPPQDVGPPPAPPPSAHGSQGVTGEALPINRRFPDLDAYLAYLRQRSHFDGAWYREVRPGVYELQTANLRLEDGDRPRRTFTREELEKKFGFSR